MQGAMAIDGTVLGFPAEEPSWREFILRMLPMMRMGLVQKRAANPLIATLSTYYDYEAGPAGAWLGADSVTLSIAGGTPPYTAVWTEYSGVSIAFAYGAGSYTQQFSSTGIAGVTRTGYYGVFVTDANTTTSTNTCQIDQEHTA